MIGVPDPHHAVGVAGAYAPAFVERPSCPGAPRPPRPVSPELMLRPSLSGLGRHWRRREGLHVSPELMLRPSLSARRLGPMPFAPSVAGAYAPAFVERRGYAKRPEDRDRHVSPELMLRPSLSAPGHGCHVGKACVSPELMLRPSLSGLGRHPLLRPPPAGVAGAYAPAFVERRPISQRDLRRNVNVSPELMLRPSLSGARRHRGAGAGRPGVAGAYAPAFVERIRIRCDTGLASAAVSPELMLRPSLSGQKIAFRHAA